MKHLKSYILTICILIISGLKAYAVPPPPGSGGTGLPPSLYGDAPIDDYKYILWIGAFLIVFYIQFMKAKERQLK